MLSLSETHGEKKLTPIATVSYSSDGVGGDPMVDLNGVLIYLDKNPDESRVPGGEIEGKKVFDEKFPGVFKQGPTQVDDSFLSYGRDGRTMTRMAKITMRELLSKAGDIDHRSLEQKRLDISENTPFGRIYRKAKEREDELKKDIGKLLYLETGNVFLIPEVRKIKAGEKAFRQVYHVAARSDAGKSTWTAKLVRLWKHRRQQMGLSDKVFIFSRVEVDNAYKSLGAISIEINQDLLTDPMDVKEELSDCLVIFDDIDRVSDKKCREYISDLRDGLLQTGAHLGTYIVNTCHHLNDWKNTRDALNEATFVTLFPIADKLKIKSFLEDKIGVDKRRTEEILNLKTRWFTIHIPVPSFVVWEGGVLVL